MYSMAMIMLEVLTHESPYHEYLDYVDIDDLLQAIAGSKTITSQLPQVLPSDGTLSPVSLSLFLPLSSSPSLCLFLPLTTTCSLPPPGMAW